MMERNFSVEKIYEKGSKKVRVIVSRSDEGINPSLSLLCKATGRESLDVDFKNLRQPTLDPAHHTSVGQEHLPSRPVQTPPHEPGLGFLSVQL